MGKVGRLRYFSNLDALRFFASFGIILAHIQQAKMFFGYSNFWNEPSVLLVAEQAVSFFFVLSGFLITFLLIEGKKLNSKNEVFKFYMRRMLRIWPLYFFAVFLGLWIYPNIPLLITPSEQIEIRTDFNSKLLFFLFVLPNIALVEFPPVPLLSHTWSIGVEEQYYLFWPWLLRFKHKPILICLVFWCFFSLVHLLLFSINIQVFDGSVTWVLAKLQEYTHHARFNCMAIGGSFAILVNSRFSKFHKTRARLGGLAVLGVGLAIALGFKPKYFGTDFYSILFGLIIFAAALDDSKILRSILKRFDYLGKISYGIYIFHPLAIFTSLHVLHYVGWKFSGGVREELLLSGLCLIGAVMPSVLSYHFFESPILRFKSRWN